MNQSCLLLAWSLGGKKGNNSWTSSASIIDLGKVAGLSAITKVPKEGYSDKVATSEGDGLILKLSLIQEVYIPYQGTSLIHPVDYYRIYIAEYNRDALGNIIGATIKYQTGTDWVQKE